MSYPIRTIPNEAREDVEQLGSKPKFWVLLDDQRWLFKVTRTNTGKDWAEKAAAELALAIGVNATTVELAHYGDQRGCISLNFVDVKGGKALVHGNEVLGMRVTHYDKDKTFGQSDHTLQNIESAIRSLFDPAHADEALIELAGYMVLDGLIGNTDRHHLNWRLLKVQSNSRASTLRVAPSFDHASSLGRELSDTRRVELMAAGRIGWYIGKGRGGLFKSPEQRHGENPLRFVHVAARARPELFRPALERVAKLNASDIHRIIELLPDERASEPAKRFAVSMVLNAQASLIEILQ